MVKQNKTPVDKFFYSEKEWDRLGCGPLPPERDLASKLTENTSIAPSKPVADK